jgi:hypothetical protein
MGMYCQVSVAARGDVERLAETPTLLGGLVQVGTATAQRISLEKAWHGLHYLLTGEVWEGNGPVAFLLAGGENVDDDEESGLRWFSPQEAVQIHQALSAVSDDKLWSRFDAEQMEELEIYPGIWDEDEQELKEEYSMYFQQLKDVVAAAAESGHGLLVTIG